jgi:hypothetical protein
MYSYIQGRVNFEYDGYVKRELRNEMIGDIIISLI